MRILILFGVVVMLLKTWRPNSELLDVQESFQTKELKFDLTRYPLVFEIAVQIDTITRLDNASDAKLLARLARLAPFTRIPGLAEIFPPLPSL